MNQLYILLLALFPAFNSDTGSFLIYNEDHNKCVYAESATVVRTAPCDESSKAQHFRWISSSQILSLSFNLCLESEKIEDLAKIILLPCNDISPVQTWECKDETLFGLKGHPLHLNYGNYDEPNVMMFLGKGVCSRWLIYETKENLCSRGYQEIYTTGGNSLGKPCQFPFKFDGKWYTECTVDGRTDGQLWCSTEKDYDTEKKWGFCPPKNSDTSFFLIYNKDHNKCVYAESATVVRTAPCDESSKAQQFRWISSSQILSLSFNLCLGSEKIEDWVKIILLPCNDISPVQTWECKNESLFGLKGHPLHLNYGNYDEPNVMLFSGTGVWSRWLIYGTKENLCSRGYQEIYTTGGNSLGKPCQFPFKYRGKWYTECTVDSRTDGQLWCSTEKDYDTEEKWGFCPPKNFAEDHQEKGISLYYICFFSTVVAGLIIMTTAVIVITIRSKTNGSRITSTDNDYSDEK